METIGAVPTYTAAGGLGSRSVTTYEWCVDTGAASLPAGLAGINTSTVGCASSGPTATTTAMLSSGAGNITAAFAPPSQNFFTVELDDSGNISTPTSAATATAATRSTSLLINSPLEVHLSQAGNAAGTDPANLLPGVTNRTYGSIGGTPTFTAQYGLGGVHVPGLSGSLPGRVCLLVHHCQPVYVFSRCRGDGAGDDLSCTYRNGG